MKAKDSPCVVNAVRVEGIQHTSQGLLDKATQPLLRAATLTDVVIGSRNVASQLQQLDIFDSVEVILDSPAQASPSAFTLVDVVYRVKEGKRLKARTGASFSGNEGAMDVSLAVKNGMGLADKLSVTWSTSIEASSAASPTLQASFTKPLGADPHRLLECVGYSKDRDRSARMSHHERQRGGSFSFRQNLSNGFQQLGYSLVWRENHSLLPTASLSIRKCAGHSLKSALVYQLALDSRDDACFPTKGLLFKMSSELAGLGGDVRHCKAEVDSQLALPLFGGVSLVSSLRGGLLLSSKSFINDRFVLGGPLSVRGFCLDGIGPRDASDVIGGDCFWAGGLSLMLPMPYVPWKQLKTHAFINGGSLVTAGEIASLPKRLFETPSLSAGVGLMARFSLFRLELNWCLPIMMRSSDQFKHGPQFGIGLDFI